MLDWSLMWSSVPALLSGVSLTLELTGTVLVFGLSLSLPIALARNARRAWIRWPAVAYIAVFRGTPALVQIALLYFGVAQFAAVRASLLWPVLREPFWCAVAALSLNGSAYCGLIFSGALRNVGRGSVEAAMALGLSRLATFLRVEAPIALRTAIPAYGNEVILTLKATSLASSITLLELTGRARVLVSDTYAPYEIFLCTGVIYVAMVFVITRLFVWIEARTAIGDSRQPNPLPTGSLASAH